MCIYMNDIFWSLIDSQSPAQENARHAQVLPTDNEP